MGILRVLVGLAFVAIGGMKISGQPEALIAAQHHDFMRHYHPLQLHTPEARVAIGGLEFTCGALVLLGSDALAGFGLVGLIAAMGGAVSCHLMFDPKDNLLNAAPAATLLTLCMVTLARGLSGGAKKPAKSKAK